MACDMSNHLWEPAIYGSAGSHLVASSVSATGERGLAGRRGGYLGTGIAREGGPRVPRGR